ncbi:hypothetical protein MtrunA17_Chr3g0111821 [Medicago truncatula]|uniref:Transmembrane protein n=1 Tax=Medicago truncatula TaxID=3880 RepID=A0A396IZ79_MEDTR|nr:hypothetical protein MtrunA17_Chr3g0111821 [Medicago truncatula]
MFQMKFFRLLVTLMPQLWLQYRNSLLCRAKLESCLFHSNHHNQCIL